MSGTILKSDPHTGLQLYREMRTLSGRQFTHYKFRLVPAGAVPGHLIPGDISSREENFVAFDRINQFLRDNPRGH